MLLTYDLGTYPMTKYERRLKLFRQQGGLCFYCGKPMFFLHKTNKFKLTRENKKRLATIDHIIPKSAGGTDCWNNIVCACRTCNHDKGDIIPEVFVL